LGVAFAITNHHVHKELTQHNNETQNFTAIPKNRPRFKNSMDRVRVFLQRCSLSMEAKAMFLTIVDYYGFDVPSVEALLHVQRFMGLLRFRQCHINGLYCCPKACSSLRNKAVGKLYCKKACISSASGKREMRLSGSCTAKKHVYLVQAASGKCKSMFVAVQKKEN